MSFNELGKIELGHNSEKFHSVSVDCNGAAMTFEMGRLAKQTAGGVMVRWGDSVVLVTACGASSPREGMDFFPLTCEYVEKTYAAGKIPGGYFKREARPREAEILNARIIDRSIRPLFPDGYRNETQVIATVLSHVVYTIRTSWRSMVHPWRFMQATCLSLKTPVLLLVFVWCVLMATGLHTQHYNNEMLLM